MHLPKPSLTVRGAPPLSEVSRKEAFLVNDDLKPVTPALRTWKARNYVGFWVADGFNLSSMMIASTALTNGLSWWQAWLAVWVGYGITAIFIVLAARTAAVHHIGFPVLARSSFGLFGSLWPVLNRVVLACVWFAYQSWIGGQCVTLVLRSWAPSYATLPGQLSGTTTRDFLSYFLFWLIQFPVTWVSPQKVRHLFTAKAICMPVAAFGLFGWCIGKANGNLGPIIHQSATVHGSELGWFFVIAVTSQMSNMVTLCVNEADFARMASRPSAVVLPQLLSIPLVFSITSLIGIFISSSSVLLFNKATWNPLDVMSYLLDEDPTKSSTRAGVFFIAGSFIIAQMGTNVAANSLSAGSDLTALLPRYVSIRRGQILCGLIGLCICPWYFAASTSSFTSYLSAYSVLLSPILGVLLADAYIIRRGRIDVPSLYTSDASSHALYYKGVNWRAYAAYFAGCALNLPGFVASVSSHSVPYSLQRIYDLAFLTGSFTAALIYVLCTEVSPVPGSVSVRQSGWLEAVGGMEVDFDGTNLLLAPRDPNVAAAAAAKNGSTPGDMPMPDGSDAAAAGSKEEKDDYDEEKAVGADEHIRTLDR